MTTSYPAALDSFTNPTATDELDDEIGTRTHSEFHADTNDAIEAIQAELGTDPKGAAASVKARIAATETVANAALPTATAATTYQPLDGELTAIAGLTSAANKLPYFTGPGAAALADLSSYGSTLIDDADAATARRTLLLPNVGRAKISGGAVQYGLPGVKFRAATTVSTSAAADRYYPFFVHEPITVNQFSFEVTTGPASDATVYVGIYAADTDLQPTGSVLLSDSQAVLTGATGVYNKTVSVALTPGVYLIGMNLSVAMTLRVLLAPCEIVLPAMGASPYAASLNTGRAAAAFTTPATAWTTLSASAEGWSYRCCLRW